MAVEAISQIDAENLAVGSGAAVGFAGTTGTRALIYVGTSPIRWRADGTSPTGTTGQFVEAGGRIDWTDVNGHYKSMISQVKFIRDATASSNATLAIAHFE